MSSTTRTKGTARGKPPDGQPWGWFDLTVLDYLPDVKPIGVAVYMLLVKHANENGQCWPKQGTLADLAGVTRETINKAIRALEHAGLITSEFLFDNRGGCSGKRYTLLLVPPCEKNRTAPVKISHNPCEKNRTAPVKISHNPCEKNRTAGTRTIELEPLNQKEKKKTRNESEYTFPLKDGSKWTLPQSKLQEYTEAYPTLDAIAEMRAARQWCRDNELRRKSARGMTAFLNGWLNREQKAQGGNQNGKPRTDRKGKGGRHGKSVGSDSPARQNKRERIEPKIISSCDPAEEDTGKATGTLF